MANSTIALDEPATIDKRLDTEQLTVGANTVERERVQVTGAAAAEIARVQNTAVDATEYGLVARVIAPVEGAGAVTARTPRTTLASDDPAVAALQTIDDIVHAINAAFSKAAAIGGQLDDTTTTAATEDNVAPVRITAQRGLHANLRNNAGTEIGTASAPVRTDPTGTTTQPVSAASLPLPSGAATEAKQDTAITALQKIDNIAHSGQDVALVEHVPISGQLDDTATATVTENQIAPIRITSARAAHANLRNTAGTEIGTAGAPVRVDPTGTTAQPITDNAGSLTVDAPTGTPVNVQIGDGTRQATVRDTGANDSLNVAIVDASGNQITTFGGSGGTAQADKSGFTEGTTNLTPIGGVLNDTIAADPTEDQAAAVRITAKRAIHVNLRDAAGNEVSVGGGTQYTEDAAAAANPIGTALNLVRKDTLASEVDADGDNVAARGTAKGELYVKHVDAIPVTDNAGSLTVDNAGTFAVQDSQKVADNAAFTDGTTPVQPAGYVFDETAGTALTENDAAAARIDSKRAQVLVLEDETTRGRRATVTAANALKVDGSAVTQPVSLATNTPVGTVAHDAADSGAPLKIGGRADTTFQAAVADADRVDALFDVYGVQNVRDDHPNRWSYHENSSSALTDATVQAAPGAGLSVYLTDIIISLGAATALNAFFEEGTTTILGPYYLEAINGRSLHIRFQQPHKCTANTAVTITTSAAVAHGIDVKGFIAP